MGLATHAPDHGANILGGRASSIATDGDIGPGMGQAQRHGPADAPRTSGDKRLFPRQAKIRHRRLVV